MLNIFEMNSPAPAFYSLRIYTHPPLYMLAGLGIQRLADLPVQQLGVVMELLSVLFSVGTLILIYLCAKEWFNELTGILGAFFYAILPAARVFDTWIKQDAMMVFFLMLFLFLFFKKSAFLPYASSPALGIAFLTKEPALFFPFVVGLFLLLTARLKQLRKLIICSLAAGLMSFWWYVWVSRSRNQMWNLFLGRGTEAEDFAEPWYFYLKSLPASIGWVVLVLVVLGIAFFFLNFRREKRGMYPLLFLWALAFLAFYSLSSGKPIWMLPVTLPAFALLGAWGLDKLYQAVKGYKELAISLVVAVCLLALGLAIPVGHTGYFARVDPNINIFERQRELAAHMNELRGTSPAFGNGDRERTMLYLSDMEPVWSYYFDGYNSSLIWYVAKDAPDDGVGKDSIFVISNDTDHERFMERVKTLRPDSIIVRKFPAHVQQRGKESDRTPLIERLSRYDPAPRRFGNTYFFDGQTILKAMSPGL